MVWRAWRKQKVERYPPPELNKLVNHSLYEKGWYTLWTRHTQGSIDCHLTQDVRKPFSVLRDQAFTSSCTEGSMQAPEGRGKGKQALRRWLAWTSRHWTNVVMWCSRRHRSYHSAASPMVAHCNTHGHTRERQMLWWFCSQIHHLWSWICHAMKMHLPHCSSHETYCPETATSYLWLRLWLEIKHTTIDKVYLDMDKKHASLHISIRDASRI